jgi:hypothetical protein
MGEAKRKRGRTSRRRERSHKTQRKATEAAEGGTPGSQPGGRHTVMAVGYAWFDEMMTGVGMPTGWPEGLSPAECLTGLIRRMIDPNHPCMLCMLCDYEFARHSTSARRATPPLPECVGFYVPYILEGTRREPELSPICGQCARLPHDEVQRRITAAIMKRDREAFALPDETRALSKQ